MRNRTLFMIAVCASGFLQCFTAGHVRTGPEAFREDLAYLARELPRRHKNAFHSVSKAQFDAAVAELNARIPTLNTDQFYVGIMRIASMIGDSHTRASIPADALRVFPIAVRRFGDDYRVVRASAGIERALGARIIKIDETPADSFAPLLTPVVTQNENPTLAPAWIDRLLLEAQVLHGVGISANPASATFTLQEDDGKQFSIEVAAITPEKFNALAWTPIVKTTHLQQIADPVHKPAATFDFRYIPSARAVYASVRSMVDVRGPAKQLFAMIRERQPDKVIIDLRQNPGGNYFHGLHNLIEPVAKLPSINRKGHLFILIGPLTGSAAVINAAQFHTMTHAILVGEAIGAKPSEYSELKTMTLPNTRMIVGYSVRYYDFAYNEENIIAPDHEVKPAWGDVTRGHDPALDWCLEYQGD